jgi:hypothetical protein
MQQECAKHVFAGAEGSCGTCGRAFCAECLVYAFGPKKAPLCIPCAVAAAGIRASAGTRPAPQKQGTSAFHRLFSFVTRTEQPRAETQSADRWPVPVHSTLPAPGA